MGSDKAILLMNFQAIYFNQNLLIAIMPKISLKIQLVNQILVALGIIYTIFGDLIENGGLIVSLSVFIVVVLPSFVYLLKVTIDQKDK